jgi:hypothetical protein
VREDWPSSWYFMPPALLNDFLYYLGIREGYLKYHSTVHQGGVCNCCDVLWQLLIEHI